jgi:Helix-turn-helix domain
VETVGQRIRRLREERSLSQRDLSEPGTSYAYISRIEAGARNPSEKALRAGSVCVWRLRGPCCLALSEPARRLPLLELPLLVEG